MSERTGPCAEAIRKIDKVAVGIVLTGEAVSIGSGSANERRSQWRSSPACNRRGGWDLLPVNPAH
jgi:hypothetical protein